MKVRMKVYQPIPLFGGRLLRFIPVHNSLGISKTIQLITPKYNITAFFTSLQLTN
jgi:hypothetical protein